MRGGGGGGRIVRKKFVGSTSPHCIAPREVQLKFGGKVILVSGDFWQLLPVLEKANRAKLVNHTLKNCFCTDNQQSPGTICQKCGILLLRLSGRMVKFMLLFLSVGTPTTFSYGQNNHISKTAREEESLGRNIPRKVVESVLILSDFLIS